MACHIIAVTVILKGALKNPEHMHITQRSCSQADTAEGLSGSLDPMFLTRSPDADRQSLDHALSSNICTAVGLCACIQD